MSKNVKIDFSITKAKSGSIVLKITQPFFWTDPYLHCLLKTSSSMLGLRNPRDIISFQSKDDLETL